MARSENQKLKMLYILKILMQDTNDENPISMNDLIDRLAEKGISAERKSLYNDIALLCDFGYDIVYRKGAQGGYFIGERDFELPELRLLADAVASSKFITRKKSEELIKKLESLTSRHDALSIQRQIYVQGRIKAPNENIYYNVDILHLAIAKEKKIGFRYFEYLPDFQSEEKRIRRFRRNGAKYKVSPLGLCWDNENYYLIAASENEGIRHFRVDKMADTELLPENRDIKEYSDFNIAAYCRSVFSMFGGEGKKVKMRFADKLIGAVVDKFGTKDVFYSKTQEGYFDVTAFVTISPQFLAWIFGFGKDAVVLAPESLRADLLDMARDMENIYKKTI